MYKFHSLKWISASNLIDILKCARFRLHSVFFLNISRMRFTRANQSMQTPLGKGSRDNTKKAHTHTLYYVNAMLISLNSKNVSGTLLILFFFLFSLSLCQLLNEICLSFDTFTRRYIQIYTYLYSFVCCAVFQSFSIFFPCHLFFVGIFDLYSQFILCKLHIYTP